MSAGLLNSNTREKSHRGDRWQKEGLQDLFVCWELGWWCAIFGMAAADSWSFHTRLDWSSTWRLFKCLKSSTFKVWVAIQGCGLIYGEERVCLHCAVLRVAPSTHVAESKAQQCIRLRLAGPCNSAKGYLSDHHYHPHDHHHHRRRRLRPSETHTSALATGSIATGDEERGGGVCVYVCVCTCICVAARHIHQQFVLRSN